MEIKVSCYAGYKGEETPKRISMADTVVQVVGCWISGWPRTIGTSNAGVTTKACTWFAMMSHPASGNWFTSA